MGIIIVVGIVNTYLLIPTAVLAVIFYKIRNFYLPSIRSIKRLEGISEYLTILGHV